MTLPLAPSAADPRLDSERGVVVPRPAVDGPGSSSSSLEWVRPDGHGSFAHGTVSGVPTRRYHGLLLVPLGPDAKRHLLLGHVEELVTVGDATRCLAPVPAAEGAPAAPPATLLGFALEPWPTWRYEVGGSILERELLLHDPPTDGGAGVVVRWTLLEAAQPAELHLAPFLPYREAGALTFVNGALDGSTRPDDAPTGDATAALLAQPYPSLPPLRLALDGPARPTWKAHPRWLRGIPLPLDLARGYDGHEDRFSPGRFRTSLQPGETALLDARLAGGPPASGADAWKEASRYASASWERARRRGPTAFALHHRAAEDFLYRSPLPPGSAAGAATPATRTGVLAGYPWFGEWGRDVFLALPGLTLARGDVAGSADVLAGALPFLRDGLLPNIYGPTREASHYGSVDASLWFARAVRLHRRALSARPTRRRSADGLPIGIDRLRAALRTIRDAYASGTALGIRGEPGGLVLAGGPGLNSTWMDARSSRGPVTPRAGCPVEIAALWILLLAELEETAADPAERAELAAALARARESFRARFWLEREGYLADLWTPAGTDRAVRPNMVLAAALETTPLAHAEAARLLERVDAELLTDRGLRTLSPRHAAYRPRYEGGTDERDEAYHQGTVWPWLLGSYVELCLRVRGAADRPRLERLLDGVDEELLRAGLGHVSEVFDAEPPRHPGGTMAQAWNTAELLRARALLGVTEVRP